MAAVNIVSGGCESTRKPPGRCEPSFSEPGQSPDRPGGTRKNSPHDAASNQTLEEKLYHMPIEDYTNILEYAKDKSKVKSHLSPEHAEIISELEKSTSKGGEEAISTLSVGKYSSSLSSLNNTKGRKGEGGPGQQPDSKIHFPLPHPTVESKCNVYGYPNKRPHGSSPTSPEPGKGKLPTQYFFNCRDDTRNLLEEDRVRDEHVSKEIESHACETYNPIEEYDLDKSSRTRSPEGETSGSSSPRLADHEDSIRPYDSVREAEEKERGAGGRSDAPERPMRKGDAGLINEKRLQKKANKAVAKGEIVTTSDKIPGYVGNKDPNLILEYLQISKPQKKSAKKEGRERRKGQDKELLVKSVSLDDDNLSINSKTISESSVVGGSNREIVNKTSPSDSFLKESKIQKVSSALPIDNFVREPKCEGSLAEDCLRKEGELELPTEPSIKEAKNQKVELKDLRVESSGFSPVPPSPIVAAPAHQGYDPGPVERLPEPKVGEDEDSYSVVMNRKRRNKEKDAVKSVISSPPVLPKVQGSVVQNAAAPTKPVIPLTVPLDSSFPPLVSSVCSKPPPSPNNGHCSLNELDKLNQTTMNSGGNSNKGANKPTQKGAWKQAPALVRSQSGSVKEGLTGPGTSPSTGKSGAVEQPTSVGPPAGKSVEQKSGVPVGAEQTGNCSQGQQVPGSGGAVQGIKAREIPPVGLAGQRGPMSPTTSLSDPMSPSPPTPTPTLPSEAVIFCGENFKEPPILPSPDFEFGFGVHEALNDPSKVEPCEVVSITEAVAKPELVVSAGRGEFVCEAHENPQGHLRGRGNESVRMPGRGRGERRQHMQQQPRDARQHPDGVGLLGKFPPGQQMMTYSDVSVPTAPRQPGPKQADQRKGAHPKQQLYKQQTHQPAQMMNPYCQEDFQRHVNYFQPFPGHPSGPPMFQHPYLQGQPSGYQLPAGAGVFFMNTSGQPHHYPGLRPISMMTQNDMNMGPSATLVESIPGCQNLVPQNLGAVEEEKPPLTQDVSLQPSNAQSAPQSGQQGPSASEDFWKDAISVGTGHQDLALLYVRPPEIDRQVFNPEEFARSTEKYVEEMTRRMKDGRVKFCRK